MKGRWEKSCYACCRMAARMAAGENMTREQFEQGVAAFMPVGWMCEPRVVESAWRAVQDEKEAKHG